MEMTDANGSDLGPKAKFDVIVVGGGPAGSASAFVARSLGLNVCLIDKATFPRNKLCGGLVTPRSKRLHNKIFGEEIATSLLNDSDSIAFYSAGRFLASVDGYKKLYFCMRYDFDASLIERCRDAGVELRCGESAAAIDLEENVLTLTGGEQLGFDVLIGADGVNSQVAKQLFGESFNQNTIGFGLEVEVPRHLLPEQPDIVEIDFAAAHWGYGWVFPKKTTFTIGVGGIKDRNPDMKGQLNEYLRYKNIADHGLKVKGQFIPFGDFKKQPGRAQVVLVGDAAGMVDPITGEGIAFALETGLVAAQAAHSAIASKKPDSAFDIYAKDHSRIVNAIRQANRWRRLIFPVPLRGLFNWAFADASTLQRGYLDILAGDSDYSALPRMFGNQVRKALIKPFKLALRVIRG